MVWTLEETFEDNSTNVTCWNSQLAAQTQACAEIQSRIMDDWDMSDFASATEAKKINDHIKNNNFGRAISTFNIYVSNSNSGGIVYYYVVERTEQNLFDATSPSIFDDDFFEALVSNDDDEDEDDSDSSLDDDSELSESSPYQASDPGATCRGPCGQFNDYAFADKPDGTFVCHGCRLMSGAFGNPVK